MTGVTPFRGFIRPALRAIRVASVSTTSLKTFFLHKRGKLEVGKFQIQVDTDSISVDNPLDKNR